MAVALLAIAGLACDSETPTDPGPVCTASVTPAIIQVAADGGVAIVAITMSDPTCAWTTAVDAGWLSPLDATTGRGSSTVRYQAEPNPNVEVRTATLTVGAASLEIRQAGRLPSPICTYTLTPASASFDDDGGMGSASVTAQVGCSWTAVSNASWVTITSGAQGNGVGTVVYQVARNETTSTRVATVRVAGEAHTVSQDGESPVACEYSVAQVQFDPCMPAGRVSTTITTSPTCAWTLDTNASWLTTAVTSGSGSATVDLSFTSNYDAPREAIAMFRWPTPSAGQNVRVSQAGCLYAVSRQTFDFGAAGGSGAFDVFQQSVPNTCGGPLQNACVWSATTDVSWITITTTMPRAGDDRVSFFVAPNTGTSARTATIAVRDKVVQITQPGATPFSAMLREISLVETRVWSWFRAFPRR